VPSSIPFSRIALSSHPDAVNLWIGNSLSVTALHKDNYENIYVQIIGAKHFVLLPPVAWAGVGEKVLRPASYRRRGGSASQKGEEDGGGGEEDGEEGGFEIVEEEGEGVPFATWDPDLKGGVEEGNGTRYSRFVEPMRVSLEEGDMLYLPALWYVFLVSSASTSPFLRV